MSMVAVGIGTGVSAIGVSLIGANSAKRGARQQTDAVRESSRVQLEMYNQTRADQRPWREAGAAALSQLNNPDHFRKFSQQDFQTDPGYEFRLSEGQKAIERAATSRGAGGGGATMKSLVRFNQDTGSNEYQNVYNRFTNDQNNRFNKLSSVAGVGQTANNVMSNAGMQTGQALGQNAQAIGNAQSAATMAGGQGIGNALNQGMNTWMNYQMMNRFAPATK